MTLCNCLLSSCDQCSLAMKRNEERKKTAAGNREDVQSKNEKAQKKEKMLKEDKKKKDEERDKRAEKRESNANDREFSKRLENDGEDVPSGRAVKINIIFSRHDLAAGIKVLRSMGVKSDGNYHLHRI